MTERPVGVFDSGLGGLTAVRELRRILPGEDIVYFGDTGRVPYGSRGADTILAYARQDIAFLLSQKVKAVLAACGTASSALPAAVTGALPVPYVGAIAPAAAAAARATKTGRVGIIGTEATIASGSFRRALAALRPDIRPAEAACPLFVPLVENGHTAPTDPLVRLAAEEYLPPVRAAGVDTLILGCTHYPLLAGAIAQAMGPGVTLIDSGQQAALALKEALAQRDLLRQGAGGGACRFYVTDDPARFGRLAGLFMQGRAEGPVERIEIENYRLEP